MGRKKITSYTFDENAALEDKLAKALRLFELDGAAKALSTISSEAMKDKLTHYQFLERLLEAALHQKEDMRIERWKKQARFPWIKGLGEYDFDYPEHIDRDTILKLAECSWINHGGKVIFFGPSGVGKTHLSIALGLEAIQKSYETRFVTVDKLTETISVAMGKDREQGGGQYRQKLLNSITRVPLLVLDELAYSRIEPEVSDFLFQIIHRRHDAQKSIILTANEPFDKWDRLFDGNKARTSAAIDRLLEDCVPVTIRGSSYRQIHFDKGRDKQERKK